ncbi:hypothetical protein ACFTXM_46555 [Streptomyces sp. NPDC056930]
MDHVADPVRAGEHHLADLGRTGTFTIAYSQKTHPFRWTYDGSLLEAA